MSRKKSTPLNIVLDGEVSSLSRNRQQYHYLYGSTDERSHLDPLGDSPTAHSPTATDQDSLVGEGLVHTDNEQDEDFLTPTNSDHERSNDSQQLIMTTGNSVKSINGNGSRDVHTPSGLVNHVRLWNHRTHRCRRNHPILYCSAVAGTLSAVIVLLAIVFFPESIIASVAFPGSKYEYSYYFKIPFPKVDRADYGDPVANFLSTELLDPAFFSRGPTESREFIFPFPTGAFWTNLVLPPTADRGLSYPIVVYPYGYKWSDSLLQVSYPAQHRVEDSKAIHDYFFPDLTLSVSESTQRRHIVYFDALSVTLRWYLNNGGHMETYLVQGSPYVTVKYDNVTPVIQAFSVFKNVLCPREDERDSLTMLEGQQRRKRRLSFGICESAVDDAGKFVTLRGVQFVLQTQEGMSWLLFTSEPVELVFDTQLRTTVSSSSRFRGIMRLALIPSSRTADIGSSNASATQIAASTGLQRLVYHAGVYPVRGDVGWTVRSTDSVAVGFKAAAKSISGAVGGATDSRANAASAASSSVGFGEIATINFQFTTASFSPAASGASPKSLLMLALPHHAQRLPSTSQLGGDQFDLLYRCIKGPMRPILGSSWSYDEPLLPIGFEMLGATAATERRIQLQNPVVTSWIVKSLIEDIQLAQPTLDENIYGFGKQSARLAQLVQISHALKSALDGTNQTDAAGTSMDEHARQSFATYAQDLNDVFDRAIDSLSTALEHFLTNNVADYLVYDSNLGGMVTINGLRSKDADFGNGRYNDHHFHYGYILYACAVMGKMDRGFVQKFGNAVDAIYFDVANDSNFVSQKAKGVFFPAARHKSWFDGHSFASGLFPFGNGKSQESSSEAVNCYYGALLWSLVRHGAAEDPLSDSSMQTDFARVLLATEVSGAQMYWHMRPPMPSSKVDAFKTSVYSPQFSQNYMVGNLGMLDAIASTWFGTESLYVHMINEIPVTAVTEALFDIAYVEQEYNNVLKPLGEVEMAWQGYLVCNHAIVNASNAWLEAQRLFSPQLDSALSKSQVLFWVATRPKFIASGHASSVDAEILSSNPGARPIGGRDDSPFQIERNSCSLYPRCAKEGLTGACCPTVSGILLECCSS